MPGRTWLPDQPPEGQEVLLAAFRVWLTGHAYPGSAGVTPFTPDVITADRPSLGIEVGTPASRPAAPGEREAADEAIAVTGPQGAAWPDGIVPPDGFMSPPPTQGGPGFGFGEGERLDTMLPSPKLATLAEDAHGVLDRIDDDCLVGVIRGWRRIASWAMARELAAVAELARRRPADGLPGSGREFVADELAVALTLTGRAAQDERDLAWQLAKTLPATLAALGEGQIDLAKARVIAAGTAELEPGHAAAVEAAVLPRAPGWTTGQLRAAVARAVLTADPAAASRQREAAQARAHVSCWTGQAGTAHLEGHDLPPAQTLAADARLGQIARILEIPRRSRWHGPPACPRLPGPIARSRHDNPTRQPPPPKPHPHLGRPGPGRPGPGRPGPGRPGPGRPGAPQPGPHRYPQPRCRLRAGCRAGAAFGRWAAGPTWPASTRAGAWVRAATAGGHDQPHRPPGHPAATLGRGG